MVSFVAQQENIISEDPKSGTTQVVVMVMGRIWRHMPIHSI